MGEINNIHDKFCKKIFSEKNNIQDFFKIALPEEVKNVIDLKDVSFDNTSHVSDELSEYFSDLVINASLKPVDKESANQNNQADIYILFEHKSFVGNKAEVFLQLFKYMLSMWQKDVSAGNPLRIIFPLIFYHGKDKWTIPYDFRSIFKVTDSIKKYLLDFQYLFYNVREQDYINAKNKILEQNRLLRVCLFLLQLNRNLSLIDFYHIFTQIRKFNLEKDELEISLRYIFELTDADKKALMEFLKEKGINEEELMPSLLQKEFLDGKMEGKLEGISQGELQMQQTILIRQLSKKFGLQRPEEEFIRKVSCFERLGNASDTILFAQTKEEVLNCLR